MAGLGIAPMGTAPYGYGTPAEAPVIGGKILDDGTGIQTGSRMIDPKTKQYAFDSYGRVKGMGDVRQMVLLAVSTTLGSSAQRSLGIDLGNIEEITEDFDRRIDGAYRACLASITAKKWVEIVSVTNKRFGSGNQESGAYVQLKWRDLTDPNRPEHTEKLS